MDNGPRTSSGIDDGSQLVALVTEMATAAEALCAIAAALRSAAGRDGVAPAVEGALAEVLHVLGLGDLPGRLDPAERRALAGMIVARVAQAHEFASAPERRPGSEPPWQLLESQWLSAEALAAALRGTVAPQLPGLQRRLAAPGSRFLDVGAGLAGLATALCRLWPTLSSACVDVWPDAIAAARERVEAAGLLERIELRTQDAAQLDDRDAFDLVWLPAGRVAARSLRAALGRALTATREGGWIIVGVLGGTSPLAIALARLRTARAGGAVVWPSDVVTALRSTGWADVRALPRDTLPSLWMIVGRRPPGDSPRPATPRPRPA